MFVICSKCFPKILMSIKYLLPNEARKGDGNFPYPLTLCVALLCVNWEADNFRRNSWLFATVFLTKKFVKLTQLVPTSFFYKATQRKSNRVPTTIKTWQNLLIRGRRNFMRRCRQPKGGLKLCSTNAWMSNVKFRLSSNSSSKRIPIMWNNLEMRKWCIQRWRRLAWIRMTIREKIKGASPAEARQNAILCINWK